MLVHLEMLPLVVQLINRLSTGSNNRGQKLKRAAKFHLMPYKVDVLFYNRRRAQDDAYFINLLFLKGGATEEREDGEGGATEEREDGDSEDLDLT
ncbi:uncharacterized protein LOC107797972 isoform X2 [Nicotiana tabacum]|uniref:Uncharacterized protein LOC107797972 isoform X2 n=2 Tax=Nicotiana tabacum TaxID=4097 RepID=A0AC58SWD9_TOBAC